jgi:hypothetical protein
VLASPAISLATWILGAAFLIHALPAHLNNSCISPSVLVSERMRHSKRPRRCTTSANPTTAAETRATERPSQPINQNSHVKAQTWPAKATTTTTALSTRSSPTGKLYPTRQQTSLTSRIPLTQSHTARLRDSTLRSSKATAHPSSNMATRSSRWATSSRRPCSKRLLSRRKTAAA